MLKHLRIFPIALVLYEVLVYLSTDMYLPALPAVRSFFSLDTQAAQTTLTMWFLGAGCCQILTGPLSDNLGRRPIMLTSMLIFALACYVCSTTSNYHVFLAARFVQGAMIGPIFVAGYAAIHEQFSEQQSIKLLALMSIITLIAPILGPIIGASIMQIASWHELFSILTITSCISFIMLFLSMPETIQQKQPLAIVAVASSYYSAIKSYKFIGPILCNCLTFGAMIAWLTMGAFITHSLGFSEHEYSFTQAYAFGCYILGNRVIPIALKYKAPEQIIKYGLTFSIIAGGFSFIIYQYQNTNALAIFTLSLITFGLGMCGPNLQKLAVNNSKQATGLKMAIYSMMISIFGALSSFISGLIQENWQNLLIIMLGCSLLALVLHLSWMLACKK